ncbi:MAG TPA: hypothetical protein PLA97_11965, partial [Rubrivivax sp.]|nr:hypothetical protein [Rubrivivax sp.]
NGYSPKMGRWVGRFRRPVKRRAGGLIALDRRARGGYRKVNAPLSGAGCPSMTVTLEDIRAAQRLIEGRV